MAPNYLTITVIKEAISDQDRVVITLHKTGRNPFLVSSFFSPNNLSPRLERGERGLCDLRKFVDFQNGKTSVCSTFEWALILPTPRRDNKRLCILSMSITQARLDRKKDAVLFPHFFLKLIAENPNVLVFSSASEDKRKNPTAY